MFDELTAQRLGQLERGASRRQWDSARMTADQRVPRGQPGDPAVPAAPAGERPLVDLLGERFDRLERKNERLEWQIVRLEQVTRLWKRAFVGALALAMALSLGSLFLAFGRRETDAHDSKRAPVAQARAVPADLRANSTEHDLFQGP
jgi:hypothetical protein